MINDRYSITIDLRIMYDIVDDRTLLTTEKNSKFRSQTVENDARFHFFLFTVFFAIYRKDFSMINDLPSISLSRIS